MSFVLIGNPANRRVQMFQEALARQGQAPANVLSWELFFDQGPFPLELSPESIIRIDSPEGLLSMVNHCLYRGANHMATERGEQLPAQQALAFDPRGTNLRYPRQLYLGYKDLLQTMETQLSSGHCTHPPDNIITMSDKSFCHERFQAAGLPIPEALFASSYEELREVMKQRDVARVFLKLRHGSSAAGIAAYDISGGRELLLTSIVKKEQRVFSSLRLREHRERESITEIINWQMAEGVHIEEWLPKQLFEGREYDFRVVVIGQRACHAVPRVSRYENPMTNLHFGNERGDLEVFLGTLEEGLWEQVRSLSEQAAALFPQSHCVGVDVMLVPGRGPVLIEVNAFGDLLPHLLWNGMDTYEAQVADLLGLINPPQ